MMIEKGGRWITFGGGGARSNSLGVRVNCRSGFERQHNSHAAAGSSVASARVPQPAAGLQSCRKPALEHTQTQFNFQ